MNFFDFLFGKRDVKQKAAEAISVEEALAELKKLEEEKLSLQNASRDCAAAVEEAAELKRAAEALAAKEISPEVAGYKIAVAMRSNLLARIPKALDEIEEPKSWRYNEVLAFQSRVQRSFAEVAKAASDNRYLFALFEQEMRAFAAHAKAFAAAGDRLAQKIQGKSALKKKISEAEEALLQAKHAAEGASQAKREVEKISSEMEGLKREVELASAAAEAEQREVESLRGEAAEALAKEVRLRARVMQRFAVLPRVLRKFAKATADEELEKLAIVYQEPVDAFLVDRGFGLKKLLPALIAAIESGGVEKDAEKAGKIISELRELSKSIPEIERELTKTASFAAKAADLKKEAEARTLSVERRKAAFAALNAAKAEKRNLEEKIAVEEESKRAALSLAEKLISELLNKETKLTASSVGLAKEI